MRDILGVLCTLNDSNRLLICPAFDTKDVTLFQLLLVKHYRYLWNGSSYVMCITNDCCVRYASHKSRFMVHEGMKVNLDVFFKNLVFIDFLF